MWGNYMASVIITRLVSDLSGDEIAEGAGESVDFAYRGVSYSIDLTNKEAEDFDKVIGKFLDNATKKGGRRRTAAVGKGDYSAKEVRTWAKSRQIAVPDRGRIP